MLWTVPQKAIDVPQKAIDFQILLVGEPHVGQRAMIPHGPWALHAKTEDWRDAFPDFTTGVGTDILGETAHTRQKVGFCDRSSKRFEERRDRGYKDHIFDAVAICYNPCSPRESFELTWTKWLPEIRHLLPSTTPIALIEVGKGECDVISSEEGEQVARLLHASFIRCRIGAPESAIGELAKAAFQHKHERVKQAPCYGRNTDRKQSRQTLPIGTTQTCHPSSGACSIQSHPPDGTMFDVSSNRSYPPGSIPPTAPTAGHQQRSPLIRPRLEFRRQQFLFLFCISLFGFDLFCILVCLSSISIESSLDV